MRIRSVVLFLLSVAPILPAQAASVQDDIRAALQSPQSLTAYIDEPLYAQEVLSRFYAARGDQAGWVSANEPDPAIQQLLDAVRRSRDDGLQPADYHFRAINTLLDRLHAPESPGALRQRQLATLELLCSDAFLLLGEHELSGRIDSTDMIPRMRVQLHRDELVRALQSVMDGANPADALAAMSPSDDFYRRMRAALVHYRELAAKPRLPDVPAGQTLHPGEQSTAIGMMIARLQEAGDLAAADAARARDKFDPAVEVAVKQFQGRHGLAIDGLVGNATRAALNESPRQIIAALRINMERWRWLPRPLATTRVMVNIAGFSASLYENDQPTLVAKVIVGQVGKQTPEFIDRIRYLELNPIWDVPRSIAVEELLPKIQADPGYPAKHRYQVLEGWGDGERQVDPLSVDWKRYTGKTLPYHFRQLPGGENPLGRVKFMFPNRYDVYMHDTPSQALFRASQCTFSHGCIRVSNAMQLAAALLRLDGREDATKFLAREVATGEMRRINLLHPVYIYIVYLTAWVDPSGVLELRPDIYTRDPEVLHALNKPLAENVFCCPDSVSP